MLRLIIPKDLSGKILASLGPTAKLESEDITLTGGKMTTDDIVETIKESTRLREELLHALRQFGVQREPRNPGENSGSTGNLLDKAQKELEEKRSLYLELQSRVDSLERELEENRKRTVLLEEVARTGFNPAQVVSREGEFNRILGRLPARKVQETQRALETTLKDQVALATGARVKDWVYVLLATPPEKTSQALQTLMLHDFIQTAIPSSGELDIKESLNALEEKSKRTLSDLELSKQELRKFQEGARTSLNRLVDLIQDSTINLRAVLRIGEGSRASRTYAWLSKPLQPKTLNALQSFGVLFETE